VTRKPGFKERIQKLQKEGRTGGEVTAQDFYWLLFGVSAAERLKKIGDSAKAELDWLRHPDRKGSTEHRAETNRAIVEALGVLRLIDSPPPPELIDLIAYQLGVSGKPRDQHRDEAKLRKAIRLIAENPDISNRRAAIQIGADRKTIRTWRANRIFQEEVGREQETNRVLQEWKELRARQGKRKPHRK
jgi:plasmid stabilization system protein ParE